MRSYILRSAGAAMAAAALTVFSLLAASSAVAETLSAATPAQPRALTPTRPPAATSRGWQQLLKIRDANMYTIAAIRDNAWAGGYRIVSGTIYPLLEHWDGTAWHAVTLPAGIDPPNGGIDYVAASSPGNVWVFIVHAGVFLVARWNGHGWQTETPAGVQPDQAVTFGPADTWAFGGSAAGHFTASGWHVSQLAITVHSVSAVSRSDIWAFGPDSSGQLTAAHWNGSSWAYQRVPPTVLPHGFTQLSPDGGIHAFGPSDVWAVGTALTPKNPALGVPMVMHWNGQAWRRAYAGPAGEFGSLSEITADGHHDLWMTSSFVGGKHMLLHEHNGAFSWLPGPPLTNDQFYASDLTWLPGTSTLLFTGFLASEVNVPYGHVESYTF